MGRRSGVSFHVEVEVEVDGLGLAKMNSISMVHKFTEPIMNSLIYWLGKKSIKDVPKRHCKSNTSNCM